MYADVLPDRWTASFQFDSIHALKIKTESISAFMHTNSLI